MADDALAGYARDRDVDIGLSAEPEQRRRATQLRDCGDRRRPGLALLSGPPLILPDFRFPFLMVADAGKKRTTNGAHRLTTVLPPVSHVCGSRNSGGNRFPTFRTVRRVRGNPHAIPRRGLGRVQHRIGSLQPSRERGDIGGEVCQTETGRDVQRRRIFVLYRVTGDRVPQTLDGQLRLLARRFRHKNRELFAT